MTTHHYYDQTFEGVDYTTSPLAAAEYEQCRFTNCQFSGADFSDLRFVECRFEQCDWSMGTLSDTAIQDCTFTNCKLLGLPQISLFTFWPGPPNRYRQLFCFIGNAYYG
jgi:fluoroquinolone resistance protein